MRIHLLGLLMLCVLSLSGCAPASSAPATPTDPVAQTDAAPAEASAAPAETAAAATAAGKVIELSGNNTKIDFVGAKPDGKHSGGFKTVTGKMELGVAGIPTKISVEVQTDSLWSDADKLTAHLKSPDFFEVNAY